jgi:prepilin-type N-terminal cleavage/methylation domain-containing protein
MLALRTDCAALCKSGREQGFTIIELMIATTIFSITLIIATSAVTRITRMYYRGVIAAQTQNTTRAVADELSRAIQFTGDDVLTGGPTNFGTAPNILAVRSVCIGERRYSYAVNAQANDSVATGTYDATTKRTRHALWRDTVPVGPICTPLDVRQAIPPGSTNGSELLTENMRLMRLAVTPVSADPAIFSVSIGAIYGDTDLIEFTDMTAKTGPLRCLGSGVGSEWCAASELTTQILRRLE